MREGFALVVSRGEHVLVGAGHAFEAVGAGLGGVGVGSGSVSKGNWRDGRRRERRGGGLHGGDVEDVAAGGADWWG